ncbi:bifunctional UDP-N-acetylglucosamine diphosphorylase/glucosamine-1-phosphate N-acetyltransferase GlmU [Paenibacillus wynnii]|uniref:bifunctional UDP-N-acetylglucosamine diphosphorylase/glucosamine-1-phosphate N-acetyltransferase GlmU n=1 Tax=Paenibacillus wynnii TaxID=268407 RepID=UPI00278FBF41|nr:bifunctional UDP-N-acetylglucosamine diphosphorylase/glucosamine-1-phosphate N-acetyltransferase GlmU [Paenibacillus wynnii]MDQ0193930.1 UDP-N-acetylglucosamine diphosphorylase/glucosamine-1-phosphate N-acetyltransferase [Paenibacillus wynnii]
MKNHYAIVLAAGKGTRMKSKLYKVLHTVCGKPMVQHVVDRMNDLVVDEIVVIVGHGAEQVKEQLGTAVQYGFQDKQLGTAHAVMMSKDFLQDKTGTTIVVSGDTPLISEKTLRNLMDQHENTQSAATVLTVVAADPAGYGRIVRTSKGLVERIVEHKDATMEEREISEVSTGIFCFDNQLLFQALSEVKNDNVQGEYYLPDVIEIMRKQNHLISAYRTNDVEDGMGVNDKVQLAAVEKLLRARVNNQHMINGVTLIDPDSTFIDTDVVIGADTVVHPGSFLRGNTRIGESCVIGPHTDLLDCEVQSEVKIQYSRVTNSLIGQSIGD